MFTCVLSDAARSGRGSLVCLAAALIFGAVLAECLRRSDEYSRSFLLTIAMLPVSACTVIMIVNGSVGTGIAIAGSFSLVRFRSLPGRGTQILALFEAMALGLACGAGYVVFAGVFTALICGATYVYSRWGFGGREETVCNLHITVPEDMSFDGMFDDILARYTKGFALRKVKTTGLGSLYRLSYRITMADGAKQKEMMDALRCRNGNLEIACSCASEEDAL